MFDLQKSYVNEQKFLSDKHFPIYCTSAIKLCSLQKSKGFCMCEVILDQFWAY